MRLLSKFVENFVESTPAGIPLKLPLLGGANEMGNITSEFMKSIFASIESFFFFGRLILEYTVKLARAKLPANEGNFTCSSQVKRSLAQFTCVICSLTVNTGKFTCFEAASTSRRTHANWLRAHVNLPEYHRHFTGSFTCGTHANLPATSKQNCLLPQAKIHATYKQKH